MANEFTAETVAIRLGTQVVVSKQCISLQVEISQRPYCFLFLWCTNHDMVLLEATARNYEVTITFESGDN